METYVVFESNEVNIFAKLLSVHKVFTPFNQPKTRRFSVMEPDKS